jgi:hypothetical protein
LTDKGLRVKALKEGETTDGISPEEHEKLMQVLDPQSYVLTLMMLIFRPEELQLRVFLHCGSWFSWRGGDGHYQRLLREVTGPSTAKTGKQYFEYQQRPNAPGESY